MQTFSAWDVVKVPFPYVGRPVHQYRPALVVSNPELGSRHGLLWVLMITSAENRRWEDDVLVSDLAAAGLPVPSVVRCAKIATIESACAARLGSLSRGDREVVSRNLRRTLAGLAVR